MIIISDCQGDQCEFVVPDTHEILMVSATNCSHCKDMKNVLSEQINSGKIKVINEEDPKFIDLMMKNDLIGVPSFLVDDNVCDFTGTETNPTLDCNGKEIKL